MTTETFLLVNSTYVGSENGVEVMAYDTLEELNGQLENESFGEIEEDEIQVFHGVLVDARFIPSTFNGSTPYIYITNPLGEHVSGFAAEAHFEKASGDPEAVALTIQELLEEKTFNFNNRNHEVTIDHVRLFFGYKMQTVMAVPDSHIDEEVIDRVGALVASMEEKSKLLKEKSNEENSRSNSN